MTAELRPAALKPRLGAWRERCLPTARAGENQRAQPISIYRDCTCRRGAALVESGHFRIGTLAATLPVPVADMGFTHVEIAAVAEHPFDGSLGLPTLGLFAPSARFGTPTPSRALVRSLSRARHRCAGRLGPGALPSDDAHGLAHFDGTALYEYEDPR